MVLIYNGIVFSHETNEIRPVAATRVDLDKIILSEKVRHKNTLGTRYYL